MEELSGGRKAIEEAMDAYDHYGRSGENKEIFDHFGTPTDYWVRSTKKRPNPVYPSKPLIGYLLKKSALNGGWGNRTDAAALLHNAGYIIVDQEDRPIVPPERYNHLVGDADRVRLCAMNYYIEPARESGAKEVSIRASDLATDLVLKEKFPNICQALGGEKFQQLAKVPPPTYTEPNPSSTTVFTYKLETESEADIWAILARYPTYWEGHPGGSKTGTGSAAFIWRVVGYLVEKGRVNPSDRDNRSAVEAVTDFAATVPEPPFIENNLQEVGYARAFWRDQLSRGKRSVQSTSSLSSGTAMSKEPLNQILYGPPGTGKTYATIDKALAILEPGFSGDRAALKAKFEDYVAAGQVRFVTFHQSFSYEDFVEGIVADADDGALKYQPRNGVFKALCVAADGVSKTAVASGIHKDASIWKLSIDGTGDSTTRDYCLSHSEARIGWSKVGDLSNPELSSHQPYLDLGPQDKDSIQNFAERAAVGDVILCIGSRSAFQAIGVVQGKYRYDPKPPSGVRDDYKNVLPVHWLAQGLDIDIVELNAGKHFTLKTMYEMDRFSWQELEEVIRRTGVELEAGSPAPSTGTSKPHVLIIDEINRGNISRIFGDLITLIEPSKRKGRREALEVTLPYSKKKFSVPHNVYLLGTMNTADRSLAGLDIALRRRFVFEEMPPRPELLAAVAGIDLKQLLRVMNQRIEVLLGRDHLLGHAYFIGVDSLPALQEVFRRQILPLLQEYFFEDWEKIALILNDPRKPKGCQFLSRLEYDVTGLFGSDNDIASGTSRWQINQAAFANAESYTGIYS